MNNSSDTHFAVDADTRYAYVLIIETEIKR